MDIRLSAKLSAYGKLPSPKSCIVDTVTHEEIDTLFGESLPETPPSNSPVFVKKQDVTKEDIDSLFKG